MSKTQVIDLTDDPVQKSEPQKRKVSSAISPVSPKASKPPRSPSTELSAPKKRSPKESKKSKKKPNPKPEKPSSAKPDIKESLMIKSLIKPGSISDRIKNLYTKSQVPPDAQITELEDISNFKSQPLINENQSNDNKNIAEKSVKNRPPETNLTSNKLDESSFTTKPPKKFGDLGLRRLDKDIEGSPVDKLLKWNSSISSDRVDIEIPKKRARSIEDGIEENFSTDVLI